ncbi:MAG TPA: hypothetical protein PLE54_00560 [Burkholderiaceae bacterium]|nr:hypothetical protein [Burkholderiaceae bacterium]
MLVVGVFAAFGLNLGLDFHDQARVADPSVWPTLHESVFQSGQPPSAVPDHALLSASDIERALPVPARTLRLGDTAS